MLPQIILKEVSNTLQPKGYQLQYQGQGMECVLMVT